MRRARPLPALTELAKHAIPELSKRGTAKPRRNKLHYVNPALRAGFTPFRLFLLSPRKPLRWVFAGAPVSPLLLLLFWTVHGPFSRFLLEENLGPPPQPSVAVAVGRGGRNGAERSPRRQAGTERAEFLPTTWGVHCTSHLHGCIPPRPLGPLEGHFLVYGVSAKGSAVRRFPSY